MEISRLKDNTVRLAVQRLSFEVGQTSPDKSDVFLATKPLSERSADHLRWFDGPGEYEVEGVMVDGIMTGEAVSYHITHDGMMLAAVTLSAASDLTDDILEKLQPAHILLLWLTSGNDKDTAQLISRFDATIIIPVQMECSIEALETAMQLKTEELERIKINSKDLVDAGQRLINLR
ncbi:hypothetical protein KBC99_01380 [Candidatus Saccharibacteria bacterium]|nr:hypothetical protein [Candidatus Saccharibacteria bacterium]